ADACLADSYRRTTRGPQQYNANLFCVGAPCLRLLTKCGENHKDARHNRCRKCSSDSHLCLPQSAPEPGLLSVFLSFSISRQLFRPSYFAAGSFAAFSFAACCRNAAIVACV